MAEGDAGTGQGDTGAGEGDAGTSFLDGIKDEGIRGSEHLSKMENLDGLAQGYIDMKTSQPVVPETADNYQVDIPTDVKVDETDSGLFRGAAHEMGLTNEQYQKVMQFDFARATRTNKVAQEAHEKAVSDMKLEMGDKYDENLATAQKVMAAAKTEELAKTDLGNNPELFRLLVWVGGSIAEDQLETGAGGGQGDGRPKDDAGKPALKYANM